MAGDYRFGGVTVTPWVMAFGGSARTDQGLTQQGSRAASGVLLFNYATSSSVNWVDFGPKLGVEASNDLAPWLAIGLGGNLGVADRSVSLSANDIGAVNPIIGPAFPPSRPPRRSAPVTTPRRSLPTRTPT
jgi:hypothetical protein